MALASAGLADTKEVFMFKVGGFWFLLLAFLSAMFLFPVGPTYAGGKIQVGDDKWIDFGMGLRSSFQTTEDAAPDGRNPSTQAGVDNFRLYINGQIHKYLKFEVNTESTGGDTNDMFILDAIAKVEFNQYINLWFGRMLAAADRAEMSGPFFSSTYTFNKTPFYPQDFGNPHGGGAHAGKYGRDEGVNLWGALGEQKRLTYVVGAFDGLNGGANQTDQPLVAGRVSYNFLNVENNPGYYTSSTYYGAQGDIFTLAVAAQHQKDGAGSMSSSSDFTGMSADLLYEEVFGDGSVVTVEGEAKQFTANYGACVAGEECFGLFDGQAFMGKALYMMPDKVGIGHLQPYAGYTEVRPDVGPNQSEIEGGLNYIIDGHQAKASLFYQHGDINRFDFTNNGLKNTTIGFALQYQFL